MKDSCVYTPKGRRWPGVWLNVSDAYRIAMMLEYVDKEPYILLAERYQELLRSCHSEEMTTPDED